MKSLSTLAAVLTAVTASPPAAATSPIGHWKTQGNKALVDIAPCGDDLCGALLRELRPDPGGLETDIHNPDPSLRGRPIEGIRLLLRFRPDGARWRGEVYNPQNGKTYKSFIALKGADTLKLTGCVWVLCQSQTWRRAP